MNFTSTPIKFVDTENGIHLVRDVEERISMLDNLVELIIFTPRGSFESDPDFGFEYWNHEFSNVNYRGFNNDYYRSSDEGQYNEITKKECQDGVRQSLAVYAPQLKNVNVSVEMNVVGVEKQKNRKVLSKYMISVIVEGDIDYGLGTTVAYRKDVQFMIEPTAKKYKI